MDSRHRVTLALGGLCMLAGLCLWIGSKPRTEPLGHATGEEEEAAATQGQAEPGVYLSLDDLKKAAEVAIHGKVRSVRGRLIDGVAFQEAIVAVDRVLQPKGKAMSEATVLVYGGEAEGMRTILNGAPSFSVDQEVVLFLKAWGPGYVIVGIQQGLYTVVDGVAIRDFSWVEFLGDNAGVQGGEERVPLATLFEEPSSAVPAPETRPEPPSAPPRVVVTTPVRLERAKQTRGPAGGGVGGWALGLMGCGLVMVLAALAISRRDGRPRGFVRTALLVAVAAGVLLAAVTSRAYVSLTTSGGAAEIRWIFDDGTPSAPVVVASRSVRYAIHAAGSDNVPDDSEKVAVANAAAAWSTLPIANFHWLRVADDTRLISQMSSADGQCVIYWLETSTLDPHGFDMAGALARTPTSFFSTGEIVDSDVSFNGFGFQWGTAGNTAGRRDVGSVAAHEIGHMAGMEHSPGQAATMKPVAPNFDDTSARTLDNDDIVGFARKYPGSTFATSRGRIAGTIRTGTNRNVHSGIVLARLQPSGLVAAAVLSKNGNYLIEGLLPGSYTIETQGAGRSMSDEAARFGVFQSTGATTDVKSNATMDRAATVSAGATTTVPLVISDGAELMKIDFVVTRMPGSSTTRATNGPVRIRVGTTGLLLGFIGVNLPTTAAQARGLVFGTTDVTVVGGARFDSGFANSIVFSVNISPSAVPGPRNIELVKADGTRVIAIGALEITP